MLLPLEVEHSYQEKGKKGKNGNIQLYLTFLIFYHKLSLSLLLLLQIITIIIYFFFFYFNYTGSVGPVWRHFGLSHFGQFMAPTLCTTLVHPNQNRHQKQKHPSLDCFKVEDSY